MFKESTYKILTVLFLIGYNFTPPILAADQIFNFGNISEKLNISQDIDTSEDILEEGISDPEWITKGTASITKESLTNSSAVFAAVESCPLNPDSYTCAANDVSLASATHTPVDGDTCDYPGDKIRINLFADVVTTASKRYDIGVWIYPNNNSTTCDALKLPVASSGDLDGDSCGDTMSEGTLQDVPLGQIELTCVDTDNNGYLDVPVITTWDQNSSGLCNTGFDTLPGATSKCKKDGKFSIPVPIPGQIIVNKMTEPTSVTESFGFNISGNTHDIDFTLSNGQSWDSGDITGGFLAGTYTVAEENVASDWELKSAVCTSSKGDIETPKSIDLQPGEIVNCTFTNQKKSANLTLIKKVVNDNGGLATPDQFGISVNGATVTSGTKGGYAVGEILTINETGLTDYKFVEITGDAKCPTSLGGTITLEPGDDITCTITNDDIAPTLTLNKVVVNDNGGTQLESAWTLFAKQGDTVALTGSGATGDTDVVSTSTFKSGTYTLSESGPTGYSASNWICVGGTQNGSNITLGLGDVATCTITNNDIAPKLTVTKEVVNGLFGTKSISDFPLFVGTTPVTSGVQNIFNVGSYVVGETNQLGYTSTISGDCDANGNVSLGLGDTKACTITNTSIWGQITVKKLVNPTTDVTKFDFTGGLSGSIGHNETISKVVLPGTYSVSEAIPTGWSLTDLVCNDGDSTGNKTTGVATYVVGNNEGVTCTYTNTRLGSISGHKWVDADGLPDTTKDRTVVPYWTIILKDANGVEITRTTTNIDGYYEFTGLLPATYIVTEGLATGWIVLLGDSKEIALDAGENETDVDFVNVEYGSIIVLKNVDGNGDGDLDDDADTIGSTEWSWTINDVNAGFTGTTKSDLKPGTYTIKETKGLNNFHFVSLNCTGSAGITTNGDVATVNLQSGEDVVCTYTNARDLGTLIVEKVVINDNGGNLKAKDFSFQIDSRNAVVFDTDGQNEFTEYAGLSYDILEVNPNTRGYTTSYHNCDDVLVPYNQTVTCTITNDDNAPVLELQKTVVNDNGGTLSSTDWELKAEGTTSISGFGNAKSDSSFVAGTYTLSELGKPAVDVSGYQAGSWSCTGGTLIGNEIEVPFEGNVKCSIINDDIAPKLTLNKIISNTNGGNNVESDWTLYATTGDSIALSGKGTNGDDDVVSDSTFQAGTYTLSEQGATGYTANAWSCTGSGTQNGSTISLSVGQEAVCSIVNSDKAPSLTIIKNIVNDNGGDSVADDFGIKINDNTLEFTEGSSLGSTTTYTATPLVFSNTTYTLSEIDHEGYLEGNWVCVDDSTGSQVNHPVTLTEGQRVTCSITNDDIAPTLKLVKVVINDDGGNLTPAHWSLTASGELGFTDTGDSSTFHTVRAGIGYILSESEIFGYDSKGWVCDNEGLNEDTVTLGLNENVTCTITNNDIAPKLTVTKVVENGEFGSMDISDFPLFVGDVEVTSGVVNPFKADKYLISETNQDGYTPTFSGDCNEEGEITLNVGDVKSCTITNRSTHARIVLQKITEPIVEDVGFEFTGEIEDTLLHGQSMEKILIPGSYTITEKEKDGWYLSNVECNDMESDSPSIRSNTNEITFNVDANEDILCVVTNSVIDPLLEIEKTNNKQTIDQIPGDEVIYTLIVTAPQRQVAQEVSFNQASRMAISPEVTGKYIVEDVVVSDIAPSGFKYIPGTWTAKSSINPDLTVDEPVYDGRYAATWELGDMQEGEVITLTYKTQISLLTDSGTYPDIAWVKGKSVANLPVLGNISTGASTPFVGTDVTVIEPLETEGGEVLGATTDLPNTGSSTYLTFASLITMILGFVTLLLSSQKKYLKKLALSFVFFFLMFPSSVLADFENLIVKIEEPKSPTGNQSFNIDFTAQDINEEAISIECYKNDILFFTLTGNSGSCPVTVETSGTYTFYVKAKTSTSEVQSATVTVEVDLATPLPVVDYVKTNNVLQFKTADDERSSMVEIFRSDKSTFIANTTTLLTTMPVVPNTAYSYTDTTVEEGKTYYYALRAVDSLGNVSTIVADKIVVILPVSSGTTSSVTVASVPQSGGNAIQVDQEGEVAGVKEEEKETNGEIEGEKDENTSKDTIQEKISNSVNNYWYVWGIGFLLLGGLVYIYGRRNKKN